MPRPTAVRVPKHPGTFSIPDYVVLNRCTGSCEFAPHTTHCAVTHQDEINVETYGNSGGSWDFQYVKMNNHTGCACDCITKESDCDPVKETLNKFMCLCQCKSSASQCDLTKQNWNEAQCECECKTAVSHCGLRKEWDYTNCGCHCDQNSKNNCKVQNLPIDATTCRCIQSGNNVVN